MISSTTSRVAYTLSSTTETLAVPFYFLENSHLKVIKTVAGVQTVLTLGTHYSVSGAGVLAGGSITMTGTGVALTNTITIKRSVPFTQLVDYVANSAFPADTHEKALDKLTMLCQFLAGEVERSLRFEDGETLDGSMALADRKGKYPYFNATDGTVEFGDVQELLDAADDAEASAAAAVGVLAAAIATAQTAQEAADAAQAGAGMPIAVTGNRTAAFGAIYEVFASATFTDPAIPQEGGYIVRVRNGTATVGGVGYSTDGTTIWRRWHSGAWSTVINSSETTIGTALVTATTQAAARDAIGATAGVFPGALIASASTSGQGAVELATSAEAVASTSTTLVAPLDASFRQSLAGLAGYSLGSRTAVGLPAPRDTARLFQKWISETPNGLNIALGMTIGDRRNLWQYTEDLGSNRYVVNSATKGTDTIVIDGITLTKITAGSFYSTLRSQVNGLGLTPYTTGEYYITSCFVVSAQDHDQWPGMPYIGATGSNGAINRRLIVPGKMQRLHMLNRATSSSHLDYGGAGIVAWGANTGYDTFWPGFGGYPDASAGAANSLVLYIGGFQVERVVSDGRYGIVGNGDSTMQGASGSTDLATSISWLHQMGAIIQCQVFNRGVSGNQTSVMNDRWATDITPLAARCKYVVIQPSAANDIPNGISLATTQAAVASMVTKAAADSLIPVVVVPPSTSGINANAGYRAIYDQLVTWIRQTYPFVIDNAKVCNDPLNPYVLRRQADWEGDGVHFGSEAARAVADAAAALPFWDFPRPSPYQPIAVTTYTAPTLQLWDSATGTVKAVSLGAADSGGTGFKALRVAN